MPKEKVFSSPRLFRSILCPIDFSEHSATALRYAAAIAKRSEARLHALYVNDPLLVAAAAIALNDRDIATRRPARAANVRRLGCSRPRNRRRDRLHRRDRRPAKLIASTAQRLKCDLVAMGTHGLSGVDKLLIGSTTERMLRRTTVPVLAVPPSGPGAGEQSAPPRSWPGPGDNGAGRPPRRITAGRPRRGKGRKGVRREAGSGSCRFPIPAAAVVPCRLVRALAPSGREGATSARIAGQGGRPRRQDRVPRAHWQPAR